MSKVYEPNYKSIQEIYIKTIIFEKEPECTSVSIFGYNNDTSSQYLLPVDYMCGFSTLTDLLLAAKESGESIITAITEKLQQDKEEYPIVVEVEDILDGPLKIVDIVLTIYKPWAMDEDGQWQEEKEDFYIIDAMTTIEELEDLPANQMKGNNRMVDCFSLLEMSYMYYQQLLKFDMPVRKARKKAGLKNKLLFRMAEINHRVINESK